MKTQEIKAKRRIRRKVGIRKNIFGTPERLRLTVFRSLSHIYAQIINDIDGKTLVSASSNDKDVREAIKPEMKKSDVSKLVGSQLGKKAIAANIKTVAFDRNGFIYHGRIKALAEGAREAGLDF